MNWHIEINAIAKKQLKKLDINSRNILIDYLQTKIATLPHPKVIGKALQNKYKGCWRYRVHKFRIICKLEEAKLTILVIKIAMRDQVYDNE